MVDPGWQPVKAFRLQKAGCLRETVTGIAGREVCPKLSPPWAQSERA